MNRTNIIKVLALAFVVLATNACLVQKKYDRPTVNTPNAYRVDSLTKDSTSMADMDWHKVFSDSLLKGHIEKALQNNLDMKKAVQQIAIANAYVKQAKAGYVPTIGLSAGGGVMSPSLNSLQGQAYTQPTSIDQVNIQGNLSWELDVWGKITGQKKAAVASYMQTLAAQRAVQSAIIANVATNYYLLLSLDKQKQILDSAIANRQKSVETMKAMKASGSVTEVAIKQNEALLYSAQAMILDISNQQRITENTLSILLGQQPDSLPRTSMDAQQTPDSMLVGLPIQLLSNRPDVIAAENGLINAFELTNSARANFYPSIKIDISGGLNSMNFANIFSVNSLFANVLGSLTQPILNKRLIRTQYEVAKAQQETAYLNYQQTILTAYKEVSDAMYSYQTQQQKLLYLNKENEALTIATNYSELLLKQGMINYLEVLRAKDNSLNAQLEATKTQYNKLKSVVDVYRALGGGWQKN